MQTDPPLHELSATASAAAISEGAATSVALVTSCLERIESRDALVSAFDRAMFGEGNDAIESPALH